MEDPEQSPPAAEPAATDVAAQKDLSERLSDLMILDEQRLRGRFKGLRKIKTATKRASVEATLDNELVKAEARAVKRASLKPKLIYPPDLPISERRDDLLDAIRDNQVVIVAGETGSGKSTQLPKLCLELGRGRRGFVGHTQPRRIAARTIAERVAEEMETTVGELVGYTVRFTDQVGDDTLVKCMTDGILLAEIQRDRMLHRYDTIIVDEAHERSLNIDFLLGYLHQLLPRRPDLKVIITSATIDTEKFSKHFDSAPVIEVSGRSYPVDMRYEPPDDSVDLPEAIADAVTSLTAEGPGDVLVFNSGERQIREATEALLKRRLPSTEIVPLYARLSAAEQHRVFEKHSGRRVVLATNVAETSLTVPGIRYVVDPGFARISRFSMRTKVQRLPIESISQASANQRSGRCGRVAPGICIRLYAEDDFDNRAAFTEPEIQRTNLASVILQMAALGLGDPDRFPFVDPPDPRAIRDGIALLQELKAVVSADEAKAMENPPAKGTRSWLTPIGRQLARLPVDPRLGRMVVEAEENGCVHEVAVIVSAMSVQDPRERPSDKKGAADDAHERFSDPDSDFLSFLHLWDHLADMRDDKSHNQFRRQCKREFLNANRIREWQDIYKQIMRVADDIGLHRSSLGVDPDPIHRSLLAGLLSQLGLREGETAEYRGARNAKFAVAPGSNLYKKSPAWVMAGALVETNRLWARTVCRIRPEWAAEVGDHLVERTYGDPQWEPNRATAMANERVALFGLPIIPARAVNYSRVDPQVAREMFIHHALIEGEWDVGHSFLEFNEQVRDEVRGLEARTRRRDLYAEYDGLFRFYDTRIPPEVASGADFDRWWKAERRKDAAALNLAIDDLIDPGVVELDEDSFPPEWVIGDVGLPLRYEFDHDSPHDGVTATVPVGLLGQLNPGEFEWNVPGMRAELVTSLVRSLPKELRRSFVPVPDTVAAVLPNLDPEGESLVSSLRRELGAHKRLELPLDALRLDKVPDHLRISFEIINDDGDVIGLDKSLLELRRLLQGQVRNALSSGRHELERTGATRWDFGTLPRRVQTEAAGQTVDAFPALIDAGDSVAIRLLPTQGEQRRAMRRGTRRLLRLTVGAPIKVLRPLMTNQLQLALTSSPHGSKAAWIEDCILCTLDSLVEQAGGPAWNEKDFADLADAVRDGFADELETVAKHASWILANHAEVVSLLSDLDPASYGPSIADARDHLARLIYDWHVSGAGADHLLDIDRYLRGLTYRLEKLPSRGRRDQELMATCQALESEYYRRADALPWSHEIEELAWMLEELRVGLFAETIGTATKISPKRIQKALAAL